MQEVGAQQAFAEREAERNRQQQLGLLSAEQAFAASENDKRRAQEFSLLQQQQGFTASENALNRAQQTGLLKQEQDFTTKRDETQFANRLKEIDAQAEADLKRFDATQGTELLNTYRDRSTAVYDEYTRDVARINESAMDPAIKEAHITEAKAVATSRQASLNTVFSNQPKWNSEWKLFAVEFGQGG